MISKAFSLRNYIMKQLMKTDKSGIMKLPNKGKVDFGEMIIRENLFKKGIDPKTITSERQLDNILNTPHAPTKPKKPGEVIEVDFGNWPEKKAGGGRTGTGLNYLLGEDDQNSRVPYGNGSSLEQFQKESWEQFQKEKLMRTWQEYQQYLKNREKEKRQKPYIEERLGTGPGPVLEAADGGRIGLKKGHSPGRRKFLKVAAGLAALPIVGKYFKWAKPAAKVADLTSVPIKAGVDGMPLWFKPLVNKVIREGEDMTKQFATKDREIVHATKISDDDYVRVVQDLDSGNVRVEYHGSTNMGEAPIQLNYKAGEIIEPTISKTGKVTKGTTTKPEFSAVEAEPRVTNWDGDIEWDGENVVNLIEDLNTDTSKLKSFATGKKSNMKEISTKIKKDKYVNDLNSDTMNQVDYIETKYGPGPDPSDLIDDVDNIKRASGGRVPFSKGKAVKGLAALMDEFFPGTTKLGQTSKPMAPKTELKRSIAGFQEREKAAKKKKSKKLKWFDDEMSALDNWSRLKDPTGKDWRLKGMRPVKTMGDLKHNIVLKYRGKIDDNLLNKILADNNEQRIAEVLATIDEALIMQGKGMGPETIMTTLRDSWKRKKNASGGRVPLGIGGLLGKFSKSEVLIKMMENTIKVSKDSYVKKNFPNFIKELKANPELANDPQVWNFFTKGLPKNQRLVVHSDDTVDFWTQSDFGPHNIETTNKFMKKHPYFTREQAIKIQNMEPEDQILEMKRLETIRNRTKQATGGLAGMLGE